MKKILIFITAIFLSIGVFGQDLNYVNFRLMKAAINAINDSKADTSLSNLASVAINTHLLPGTDGAVNLGSATYKWGNIFIDSAKVINFNNGDITATHSDNALTFAGGNIVLPSTTSVGDVSATEISYVNGVTSSIQTQLNNKADTAGAIDLEEFLLFDASTDTLATKEYARGYGGTSATGGTSNSVFVQLSDTVPIAVFSAGAGNAADTSYFSTSTIYGAFYNKGSDTIKVTEVRAAMIGEAGDTLGLQIYWNDTLNKALGDSYVKLNTDPLPVGRPNGLTTGTVDVSFAASDIPPNVWVWAKTPTVLVTKKPSMLTVTLSGYKVPSYIDRFSNVRMLSDTIVLATFGAGGGNATDTLSFTTSTKYGAFFNAGSDTLNITELRAVMGHGIGTDTLNIQVQWHATLGSGSATKLNTTDLPILSTTTGTTDTSFDNAKIPPNVWVWATTPYVPADALKRKPTFLLIQLTGYKIPKY